MVLNNSVNLNLDVIIINKNNFYLFNNLLVDFNNKLRVKKSI